MTTPPSHRTLSRLALSSTLALAALAPCAGVASSLESALGVHDSSTQEVAHVLFGVTQPNVCDLDAVPGVLDWAFWGGAREAAGGLAGGDRIERTVTTTGTCAACGEGTSWVFRPNAYGFCSPTGNEGRLGIADGGTVTATVRVPEGVSFVSLVLTTRRREVELAARLEDGTVVADVADRDGDGVVTFGAAMEDDVLYTPDSEGRPKLFWTLRVETEVEQLLELSVTDGGEAFAPGTARVTFGGVILKRPASPELAVADRAPWATLAGPDALVGDDAGRAVDVDGNLAVVGAPRTEIPGVSSGGPGRALVYERRGATWRRVAELVPAERIDLDWFGISVDVDEAAGRIAVGAPGAVRGTPTTLGGRVHVFERDASGAWGETAVIARDEPEVGSHFGYAISLDGDRLAVGALLADTARGETGAAFLYEHTASGWEEVQTLAASDGSVGHHFGETLSLAGGVLAVGAHFADGAEPISGATYVFERAGDAFVETAKLFDPTGHHLDRHGHDVSTDGVRILVGGITAGAGETGAAWVYRREGDAWLEEQRLLPTASGERDQFGATVAIEGDELVVGSPTRSDAGLQTGAAFLFRRTPAGDWQQHTELLAPDAGPGDTFGAAVALAGDRIVAGAPGKSLATAASGAAYLFALEDADGDGFPPIHDCRDGDRAVHPGAVEIPENGIDDDCDPATPFGGCGAEIASSHGAAAPAPGAWLSGGMLLLLLARGAIRRVRRRGAA